MSCRSVFLCAAALLAWSAAGCGPTDLMAEQVDAGVIDAPAAQADRAVWNPDAGGRPPPCDPDDPYHMPQPEECNSTDDDCDGVVDNNVEPRPKPDDPCTIQVCQLGTWVDAPPEFAQEICNGCDDDGDGCTDGILEATCVPLTRQDPSSTGTGCPMIQKCVEGNWVNDGQAGATDEVCDGIDNDCDGIIDNIGLTPCFANCNGTPNIGVFVCENGQKICRPNGIINIEICDNVDNDCDGLVDEGIPPQPCACGSGQRICQAGVWVGSCGTGCVAGTYRWCDDPQKCHWGKQECIIEPDGQTNWGDCVEVTDRPTGCEGQLMYDAACCDAAGECCQDAFHTWESCGHCEEQCLGQTYRPCT